MGAVINCFQNFSYDRLCVRQNLQMASLIFAPLDLPIDYMVKEILQM